MELHIDHLAWGKYSSELHIDHLNRVCKEAITALDSDRKFGGCYKNMNNYTHTSHFDQENNVTMSSGKHSRASSERDRDIVVKDLIKYHVL